MSKILPEFAVIDFDKDAIIYFVNASTPAKAALKYLREFANDAVAGHNIMVLPTNKQTNFIGRVTEKKSLKYTVEPCD